MYYAEIRGSECNSLIEELGPYTSEEIAENMAQDWFDRHPEDAEILEYSILER